jgi:hypothetical protein
MQTIPEVTGARPTSARRVWLSFADGQEGEVDVSRYLGYGPVFEPLADEKFFRQLRVEAGTIACRTARTSPRSASMNCLSDKGNVPIAAQE